MWNNGFSCQPINNRVRVCCGPENRRECCFADRIQDRADLSIDSEILPQNFLNSYSNKNEANAILTHSSYVIILTAIGFALLLLLIVFIAFIYVIRRKVKNSSSSSSSSSSTSSTCSSKSSLDKNCPRLSVAVANSLKSNASSPVASTYADYWSRTIITPSEWTSTAKPYSSFIGGHPMNTYNNYYSDQ